MPVVDNPAFRIATILLLGLTLAAGLYGAWVGNWVEAGALLALGGLGGVAIKIQDRLPALFVLLVVIAGVVNAAGYVVGLWHETTPFDEIVHAFTSFSVCAGVGWLILDRTELLRAGETGKIVLALLAIGLLLGLLWEVFEWAIGIIGGAEDTMVDLLMDGLGAAAAGLFCAIVARRRRSRAAMHSS